MHKDVHNKVGLNDYLIYFIQDCLQLGFSFKWVFKGSLKIFKGGHSPLHTMIDQFSTMYTLMTFICISIWNTVFKESSKVVVAECSYIKENIFGEGGGH